MAELGWATLGVIPSFRGFGTALDKGTSRAMLTAGATGGTRFGDAAGKSAGSRFGSVFKSAAKVGMVGLGAAAFGAGAFIKDAVELEAAYGKTFAQIRVATGAAEGQMERLDDLAIKLGKDTVFSANDASEAMLELAKNGITTATIEAGALKSALTLAAAGGVDLEDAAGTMGNALNAFGLDGKKARNVAAALAGAANASSASVGSLAEGLQQSSATAADMGLSVQETTAGLSAFANAGIAGSDAGTSLKTMLSRLVPQTDKAQKAMEHLGLDFTKNNGEIVSFADVAEQLQNSLGGLSAEERSTALNTIFGSDARRAATVLMNEGAEGIEKYTRATSDLGAAEDMAKANMSGTAGAIERLRGSWETTKLEFGKAIAPVAADFLDSLAGQLDRLAPKLTKFGHWFTEDGAPAIKDFTKDNLPKLKHGLELLKDVAEDVAPIIKGMFDGFSKLPDGLQKAIVIGAGATFTAKKVGLIGGGGGALSMATSALKVVKTFETNPAALGGGGLGGGATGGGAAAAGTRATSLGRMFGRAFVGFLVADGIYEVLIGDAYGLDPNKHKDPRDDLSPIIKTGGGAFGIGLNQDPDALKGKRYNYNSALFDGVKQSADAAEHAVDQWGLKIGATILGAKRQAGSFDDKLTLVGNRKIRPHVELWGIDTAQAKAERLDATLTSIANNASSGIDAAGQTVVNAVTGGHHRNRRRNLGGMP